MLSDNGKASMSLASFPRFRSAQGHKRKLNETITGMVQGQTTTTTSIEATVDSSHKLEMHRAGRMVDNKEHSTTVDGLKRGRYGSVGTTSMICDDAGQHDETLDPSGPESPDVFLKKLLLLHYHLEMDTSKTTFPNVKENFFDVISEKEMQSYPDVIGAVRQNDVSELRLLQESGHSLNCCNAFGESLIHVACRRGFVNTVTMLLEQPNLCVRIVDDCGRTPLHDLCWNPSPQLELCKLLLEREPSLLFFKDKRNFTPFDYTRKEHWTVWKRFLMDNKSIFKTTKDDSNYDWMFSRKNGILDC